MAAGGGEGFGGFWVVFGLLGSLRVLRFRAGFSGF